MDAPNQPLSPEVRPGGETLPNVTPEEAGTAAPNEVGKQAAQSAPVAPLPVQSPVSGSQPAVSGGPVVAGPAVADDVDVIEKEWVDHAEAIIGATKDDPFKEEEAVEDMQIEYMKKRFGKDIAKSDDNPASG